MHPISGRVHWGWCVFPLHNQCFTQTLAYHRVPSNHNTRWRLLNLNNNFMIKSKIISFPTTIPLMRHKKHVNPTLPRKNRHELPITLTYQKPSTTTTATSHLGLLSIICYYQPPWFFILSWKTHWFRRTNQIAWIIRLTNYPTH
jgi:hypothetical protein